jgi:hypothetical protein
MTATTTTGIRISPQLWAEFGLLCKKRGGTRNARLVDLIRADVVSERVREGVK